MAYQITPAVDDVVLASTTETQEELDHGVNHPREHFDPDKVKKVAGDDTKKVASESSADSATVQQSKAGDKSEEENDDIPDEQLPKGVQKRINKLTARAKTAEETAEDLRKRLDAGAEKKEPIKEPAAATAKASVDPEPERSAFGTQDEWLKEHNKWSAREALRSERAAESVKEEDARIQATYDQHLERQNTFREEHPDYDKSIRDCPVPMSEAMAVALIESENGPAVMYHLAKNQPELEKIVKMSRVRQAMEIGRISSSLLSPSGSASKTDASSTPRLEPIRTVPAPIRTVNSGSTKQAVTSLSEMSTDDFIAERNKQTQKRR